MNIEQVIAELRAENKFLRAERDLAQQKAFEAMQKLNAIENQNHGETIQQAIHYILDGIQILDTVIEATTATK
jgi:hypothetical protein